MDIIIYGLMCGY